MTPPLLPVIHAAETLLDFRLETLGLNLIHNNLQAFDENSTRYVSAEAGVRDIIPVEPYQRRYQSLRERRGEIDSQEDEGDD